MIPCPICDTMNSGLDAIEAFTLGAGLGAQRGDLGVLRDMMCSKHRMACVMSMVTVRQKVDALHAARAPSDPRSTK